jgi:hypothetical protein
VGFCNNEKDVPIAEEIAMNNIEKGYVFITDITSCTEFLTHPELQQVALFI